MVKKHLFRSGLAALAVFSAVCCFSVSSYAVTIGTGSQSYRISVLKAIGTADSSFDSDEPCTRAEFARLMVLSSSEKDTSGVTLTSAAANDVPASYEGSQYIKTALRKGWMRTRLGGNFAPEETVTLNEAAKATLAALGYTDEDFSTNISQERLSLFKSLDLDEGVNAVNGSDALTKRDCINIIYNLLRTNSKDSSSIYGSAIDLTLSADNELNATNVIENSLTGPILAKTTQEFRNAIPFDLNDATFYFNGQNSGTLGKMYIDSQINHQGYVILYYNDDIRTVWAYGDDGGVSTYNCVRGKVTSIVYDNDNIAAPSAVYIDSVKYSLNSSDVKFMFSLNGDIQVGDYVVLICQDVSDTNDEEQSGLTDNYAIAVIKWDKNKDGSTAGTIFSENATVYRAGSSSSSETQSGSQAAGGSAGGSTESTAGAAAAE